MNHIADIRKAHGLSQSQLASQLGIAQNTLSQYENGIRTPTKRIISNISKMFEVTENYVLGYPEPTLNKDSSCSPKNISDVTKLISFSTVSDANFYLNLGWKLLHVGTKSETYDDGSYYSYTEYVLGWYGDPKDTLENELPEDGSEKYDAYGWYNDD
nr:helix-turn-helix domain-containing protein [uncultured Dysosmobacter sp.]